MRLFPSPSVLYLVITSPFCRLPTAGSGLRPAQLRSLSQRLLSKLQEVDALRAPRPRKASGAAAADVPSGPGSKRGAAAVRRHHMLTMNSVSLCVLQRLLWHRHCSMEDTGLQHPSQSESPSAVPQLCAASHLQKWYPV